MLEVSDVTGHCGVNNGGKWCYFAFEIIVYCFVVLNLPPNILFYFLLELMSHVKCM